jgi:hypothetical protein
MLLGPNDGDPDENYESAHFTGFAAFRPSEEPKASGSGIVRILCNKANQRNRLLMRNKDATTVLLNHYILPGMELNPGANLEVRCTAKKSAKPEAPEKKEWILRFRTAGVLTEFTQAYERAFQANTELREAAQ